MVHLKSRTRPHHREMGRLLPVDPAVLFQASRDPRAAFSVPLDLRINVSSDAHGNIVLGVLGGGRRQRL